MCFGAPTPVPYGEPIGPPDQKKYVELWMANQVMTDRQMRRTRTAIAAPSPSLASPIVDDDEPAEKLGD